MTTRDHDFSMNHKYLLEDLVTRLVGFSVDIYWGASAFTGVGEGGSYQVMPSVEPEGVRYAFWNWHLDHNEQWFLNPLEAAAAFVQAWRTWCAQTSAPRKKKRRPGSRAKRPPSDA